MAHATLLRLVRLTLGAVLALALAASAFAHRMPVSPDQLAFVLATGATTSDLCGDGPVTAAPPCLACQIAGAALLPPLPTLPVDLRLAAGGPTVPGAPGVAASWPRDRAHPAQGPPAA